MILSLENISKHYGGERVLHNAALTIEDDHRIGLIGVNGCGKSTLLRIIADLEIPDAQPEPEPPRITVNKNKKIGFLAQNSGLDGDSTVITEMRSVFAELLDIAERLDQLREYGNLLQNAELADEYSKKTAYFESNDGYLIDIKISKILNGMGFPPELHGRVISTLSGGERTRLALAKLLLENPDLLILDEPTNHLDFDTVLWLEEYLKDYKGALLIVSHDRYFLDRLVTSVCEIERGKLRRYKGNYTEFTRQKAEYTELQMKEYEAQTEEIAKLKDYIARNITRASTSNMAKSRAKQLEKIEANRVEKPKSLSTRNSSKIIRFAYKREPHKSVLTVDNIKLAVGDTTLVNSLSFGIERGEKLAVIGANGSGKSTLLKAIQGKRGFSSPVGTVEWGENVTVSYFEQTNTELFSEQDTALNAVHKLHPRMTELEIRSLLGGIGLTGEDAFKRVGALSGGERAKLRLAIMTLEGGNVLILDEPTNHLDISARDVLEAALCEYTGTIIFVSHDRYLLNKLATRILEITPETAFDYKGGFESYIQAKSAKAESLPRPAPQKQPKQPDTSYRSKEQRAEESQRRVRVKKIETEINRLEVLISELQSEMETPQVFADYTLLQEKCALYEKSKSQLAELTDEWLELSE